jgi:predicted regulator of Ras-like GTPase activity (Roadblock/LC7/MglB family)
MADEDAYSFALKNALNEIQNICPDIKSSFMFREDGAIVAADENTPEKTLVRFIDSLDCVMEKAETIGGVEGVLFEGSEGRVNLSCVNDLYLVTVTTKNADMNYVNTVTRVLIPTVLRLLEKTRPFPLNSTAPSPEIMPEKPLKEPSSEELVEEPNESTQSESKPPKMSSEIPVNQLIVENIGGLLVASDTVRIDGDMLSEWELKFDSKKIEEVDVETFDGKTMRSKVKPIKDAKCIGKGLVQMPEKIQLTLEIRKGELVRVKPVVE